MGINNSTKSVWYPAHVVDSGRATDFLVVADDPINGEVVGASGDMGEAQYTARVHNLHVSGSSVMHEVDIMFQSEIHFDIHALWDGGIIWSLGDGDDRNGVEDTIEEALAAMTNAARRVFPESSFAMRYASDVVVASDQRYEEDLMYEIAGLAGVDGEIEVCFDESETGRPDSLPWTVVVGDRGFGGATQVEALRFALTELSVPGPS